MSLNRLDYTSDESYQEAIAELSSRPLEIFHDDSVVDVINKIANALVDRGIFIKNVTPEDEDRPVIILEVTE